MCVQSLVHSVMIFFFSTVGVLIALVACMGYLFQFTHDLFTPLCKTAILSGSSYCQLVDSLDRRHALHADLPHLHITTSTPVSAYPGYGLDQPAAQTIQMILYDSRDAITSSDLRNSAPLLKEIEGSVQTLQDLSNGIHQSHARIDIFHSR